MIIGTLTSKASLTEEMSVSLVDLIAKVFNNEVRQVEGGNIIEMGLMVIIQMMQVCHIYENSVTNKCVRSRKMG